MGSSSASCRVYLRRTLGGFSVFQSAGGTALWRAKAWSLKERATYDRMIAHQLDDLTGAGPGTKSYPPLRARTASLSPSEMMTASTSTRSILPWCAPASASATGRPGARQQRGAPGPGAVLTTSASSARCARPVCRSSTRSRAGSRFGEFVSFAELQAITDLTLKQITSL